MTTKEQELNKYLMKIAQNLDISDTMRDKAIDSYKAVGRWLGDSDDDSDVKIMPQGSFNLGTVIKPVTDNEDYDIDLVCLLKDKKTASEAEIKNVVGDRLKEHYKYKNMLEKEGKRCWTLNYDEFHMDVLPCAPNNEVYFEPLSTEIRLTHKEASDEYAPKYSNPFKYHEWFENQMQTSLQEVRKAFLAEQKQVEIDKVPLYKVRTPLQITIQLLKRHRDIMYKDSPDAIKKHMPISMIITTLAAHAYNNENTVFEALQTILGNMHSYIKIKNGEFWVENPVLNQENFAEKWNSDKEYKNEFYRWLERAKKEILEDPITTFGIQNVSSKMQIYFGESIVRKSFLDLGYETKSLRESNSLYVAGLTGGLTSTSTSDSKKVGGHTFFGK